MEKSVIFADTLPITLLTGSLGSGKTTVLNRLLREPALSQTAVIINEFGEIGIDHDLVETASEDMVLLKSGCVCCTIRSDLIDTLRALFLKRVRGQIEFDRIVIETTGLADPAPVLHALIADPLVRARFRLDGVVTTVDAVNGWDSLDRSAEAVKQVALADRLLLTKIDLANPEITDRLIARLHALNPAANILRTVNGAVDHAQLFDIGLYNSRTKSLDAQGWLNDEAFGHAPGHHDDGVSSFAFAFDAPVTRDALNGGLKALAALKGPNLLRVKGLVKVAGLPGPVVIQGAQHVFHPPVPLDAWPTSDRRTRIVFITRDLDEAVIRDAMKRLDYPPDGS